MELGLVQEVVEGILVNGYAGNLRFVPERWLSSVFGGQCFFLKTCEILN